MSAPTPTNMLGRYSQALQDFLLRDDEAGLLRAYELGREAVARERGLLNFVDMHRRLVERIDAQMPASLGREDRSLRFLTESLAAFALLHMRDQEANAALRQMNELLENEARRIARALHDQAATMLAVIYLDLADAGREAADSVQSERVTRIVTHLDQLREQLRRLSHELHPPMLDQLGLVPALRSLTEGLTRNAGLEITLGAADLNLPTTLATVAYRVVHEALTNVVRHAQAQHVDVRLWLRSNRLQCVVQDDGVGFDLTQRRKRAFATGLGLIGMRERVHALQGRLHIWSAPGHGTIVRFSLPRSQTRRA
ncbi:sensor histidine kinase [Dokdonella sp.]|uniref:ATP-binding protein n=1 Tax=Dokdonella sp. TaxID=2291710 RepID=UPI001B03B105|nr:sensor histidine kinase [Dokdonella sp.]MBO9662297.1 sensor histidine kinase [Dokdonella sp.]